MLMFVFLNQIGLKYAWDFFSPFSARESTEYTVLTHIDVRRVEPKLILFIPDASLTSITH